MDRLFQVSTISKVMGRVDADGGVQGRRGLPGAVADAADKLLLCICCHQGDAAAVDEEDISIAVETF